MKDLWVSGVNNLKVYGRWAFTESRDAFAKEEQYGRLVASFTADLREGA